MRGKLAFCRANPNPVSAFSLDYQIVMIFTLCAIPLAIMIGSTRAALRAQSAAPEHAVIE
jgi:DHA2 family multidrug resistance protein